MPNASVESEPQLVQPTRNDLLHIYVLVTFFSWQLSKQNKNVHRLIQLTDNELTEDPLMVQKLKPRIDSDRDFIQTSLFLLGLQ